MHVENGRLAGIHPFVVDAPEYTARVENGGEDPEFPLDGWANIFLLPEGEVLLRTDILNWPLAQPTVRPQAVIRLQLLAFAEHLEWWPTREAYEIAHSESVRHKARWIVPTGLMPSEKGGTDRATAAITGLITNRKTLCNDITGATFLRLRLDTRGGELDAVAPLTDNPPPEGAIVTGHFWLAGVVLGYGTAPLRIDRPDKHSSRPKRS